MGEGGGKGKEQPRSWEEGWQIIDAYIVLVPVKDFSLSKIVTFFPLLAGSFTYYK